ncbi:MAG: DegT/DnrJ/EryC1/StrS family aminotransferase, partial [Croceimicrobium sp.]
MKPIQMVDLGRQYAKIQDEINASIQEVIDSTSFIKGSKVKEFESELGTYLDGSYIIGCGNGTDALQIALMALDLKPGDEVIVPS